jgi:hypothetical protein
MHTDVAIPADRNVTENEAENNIKKHQLTCRDTANVEHEMYDNTGNNWRYQNSNKTFEGKIWKPYQENIQQIRYNRQLYWEHHT